MSNIEISKSLWNDSKEPSSEVILEQYKLYVEMADRISTRRDIANAFFLTLNGLILSAGPAIIEKGLSFQPKWLIFFPYLVILLELFFWWRLITSYKQLNGAKFQIIGVFEEKLPARPYGKTEWELLLKEGKDKKIYWPLTHIEMKIPWLFFVGYTIVLIVILYSN